MVNIAEDGALPIKRGKLNVGTADATDTIEGVLPAACTPCDWLGPFLTSSLSPSRGSIVFLP